MTDGKGLVDIQHIEHLARRLCIGSNGTTPKEQRWIEIAQHITTHSPTHQELVSHGYFELDITHALALLDAQQRLNGGDGGYPTILSPELKHLPRPAFLIDQILDQRGVALLSGRWRTGKSFVALSWLLSANTGTTWLGHQSRRQGPVLLILGEGLHGLNERIEAWQYAWHATPDEFHILHEPDLSLVDPKSVDKLLKTVARVQPVLTIIDTYSAAITGADENSAKDMSVAVSTLKKISETADGSSVAGVHHSGKNGDTGKVRGSSVLQAGVDRVWEIDGTIEQFTLTATKVKDGPEPEPLTLRCVPVLNSLVPELVVTEKDKGGRECAVPLAEVIAELRQMCIQVALTKTEMSSVLKEAFGVSRRSGFRYVARLIEDGTLKNVGTERDPRFAISDDPVS